MKTTCSLLAVASVLGAVFLAACSTPESRISDHPDVFARLTPAQQALVKSGQVALGFDQDTVKLALGDPDRVTVRTNTQGQTQVWHYTTYQDDGVILRTENNHTVLVPLSDTAESGSSQ